MLLKLLTGTVVSTLAGLGSLYYVQPKYIVKASTRWQVYRLGLQKQRCVLTDRGYQLTYLHHIPSPGGSSEQRPVMLFVHGFIGDSGIWLQTIKNLPRDIEVYAVDMPGHGESDCDPDSDLCLQGLTERLHQFVGKVGLSSHKLHVVGQSMGGTVAGLYAAKYPANVQKVTVICPAIKTPEPSELVVFGESKSADDENNPLIPTNTEEMEAAIQWCVNAPSGLPKQILQGIVDMKRPSHVYMRPLFQSLVDDTFAHEGGDQALVKHAAQITASAQVIWGDKDRVVDASGAKYLQSLLPQCDSLVILENTGHSINMIQPQRLAEELAGFYNKSDEQKER